MSSFQKIISNLTYLITLLLPKKNWATIQSFPVWEDSILVLYRHLLETKVSKIIWLVPEMPKYFPVKIDFNKTEIIKRKTIKGFFYYSLSKYVFITHGLYFRSFPKNQISINIWHGMPLKKIGLLNNGLPLKTSYTLSTSKFFNPILKNSFGVSPESILQYGLPRNEVLSTKNISIRKKIVKTENTKLILWLPTYRKSKIGEIREDGIDFDNPFHLPDFNQEVLNHFLKKHNLLCFLKVHPMTDVGNFKSLSNIQLVDDEYLYRKQLTLYQILGATEFIITDISSIVVDYLLIDKPIILSFADKEAYLQTRGLNSMEIINNAPGKICSSQNEILEEMQQLINGTDIYSENRKLLKELYHGNTDYLNCSKNLLEHIKLK